jgi:hypothetical protein
MINRLLKSKSVNARFPISVGDAADPPATAGGSDMVASLGQYRRTLSGGGKSEDKSLFLTCKS